MKRLSDYKGEEAIELWADLIDPITQIIGDDKIRTIYGNKPKIIIAKEILKLHKEEAIDILTRIDPTPINGINIVTRIIEIIADIEEADELQSFFGSAGQAKTESASTGSVTENTEGEEI